MGPAGPGRLVQERRRAESGRRDAARHETFDGSRRPTDNSAFDASLDFVNPAFDPSLDAVDTAVHTVDAAVHTVDTPVHAIDDAVDKALNPAFDLPGFDESGLQRPAARQSAKPTGPS